MGATHRSAGLLVSLSIAVAVLAALPAVAIADCNSDFDALIERYRAAGPFRLENAFNADGTMRKIVTEVVKPDRFRQDQVSQQSTVVGTIIWVKQDGRWVRAPHPLMPDDRKAVYFDLADQIASAKDRRCNGRQAHDGKDYEVYTFTSRHRAGNWDRIWTTTLYVEPGGLPAFAEIFTDTKLNYRHTYTYDGGIAVDPPN